jgi:hypothetical protein
MKERPLWPQMVAVKTEAVLWQLPHGSRVGIAQTTLPLISVLLPDGGVAISAGVNPTSNFHCLRSEWTQRGRSQVID